MGSFIIMVYKCCIVGVVVLIMLQRQQTLFFFQKTTVLGKDGLNLSTEKTSYQHRRRTFVKIISNPNILEKAKTTRPTV